MDTDIEKLQIELDDISHKIADIQEKLNELDNEKEEMLKLKKSLQWQAMFYIEKINNLKDEVASFQKQDKKK